MPDDAPAIARLLEEGLWSYRAFASVGWEPPPSGDWPGRVSTELARSEVWCLLALADDEPVGHVSLSPRTRHDREPPPPGT